MWAIILTLFIGIGSYFWDIGVDVLVGRQQIEKTFPKYKFGGLRNDIKFAIDESLATG